MTDRTVEHDHIMVPEGMTAAEVRVLAERKAQSQLPDGHRVVFLYLHGATPVADETGASVEWRYSYQAVPPEGSDT